MQPNLYITFLYADDPAIECFIDESVFLLHDDVGCCSLTLHDGVPVLAADGMTVCGAIEP